MPDAYVIEVSGRTAGIVAPRSPQTKASISIPRDLALTP